jgi:hypothetical protein
MRPKRVGRNYKLDSGSEKLFFLLIWKIIYSRKKELNIGAFLQSLWN